MTTTAETWRWPFAVGDTVIATGDWGSFVDELTVYSHAHPDAVYTVTAVAAEGRWLQLRDDQGTTYPPDRAGFGFGYFRVAGDCGEHVRGCRDGCYRCMRCDLPMPEGGAPGA